MADAVVYDAALIQTLASGPVQDFLEEHQHHDPAAISLRFREIWGVPGAVLANQIKCRQKARNKLPEWYAKGGVVYPPSLNLEQSSSQATGRFKQELALSLGVGHLADLSGGFGVDSYYFSKGCEVAMVEPNGELIDLARHNHQLLAATLTYHTKTAEEFLSANTRKFDLIFVDPSRRSSQQQRLWRLADGSPNAPQLQTQIFDVARWLLVKASPLQDIQQALRELRHVAQVLVVSVDNECKELLFLCEKGFEAEPDIRCCDLTKEGEPVSSFFFKWTEEQQATGQPSEPLTYLYEPNAAILKGGAFKLVAQRFGLKKLAPHTHLYTSPEPVAEFPGRRFRILEEVKPTRALRQQMPGGSANILVRNYPLSVDDLKKKTGLLEGGELFLIGCSSQQKKHLFITRREH